MCISASVRDIVVEILFRDLEYLIDKYMTDMRKVMHIAVQYMCAFFFISYRRRRGKNEAEIFDVTHFLCLIFLAGFLSHVLGRRTGFT